MTLAAHQIVVQAFNLLSLILDALAIPAQTLVAAALGRGSLPAAMHIGRRVLRLSLFAGVGLGVVLAAVAGPLPYLFTPDADVASHATAGLLVLAVGQLPAAVAMSLDGVLIGGGDYRFLGRASIAYLAVRPMAVATLVWPALGIVGVWLAMLSWLAAPPSRTWCASSGDAGRTHCEQPTELVSATHGSSPTRMPAMPTACAPATLPGWSSRKTQPSGSTPRRSLVSR